MTEVEPFQFYSRLSLTLATGRKARSLRELFEGIQTVTESVIYQHTHAFLHRHHYLVPEPANDFAYWTTHIIGDEALGERLAAIDTVHYHRLEDLRHAFLNLWNHAKNISDVDRQVPEGQTFYFLDAQRFSLATPYRARNLQEFSECLKRVSIASLYLHIFEARLRLPLGRNDFSNWFEQTLHDRELALQVEALDPYSHTLENLRQTLLTLIQERITRASAQ